MRSPDSTAEIGAGAEGWASGSQAWNGTRAALRPNPRRKKAAAMPEDGSRVELLEGRGHGREVEAARHAEEDGDRGHDEGRRHDREHQVLEGGLELVVAEAESDEGVGGDRGHLEEDIDAEQVRGQDEAVHPGDHDQVQGVEVRLGAVVLHVVDGEEAGREADQGDGHEHEQAEPVEGQPEVDGFAEPGGLLEDGAARDEGPPGDRGVDKEEEERRVGQQVRAGRAGRPCRRAGGFPPR